RRRRGARPRRREGRAGAFRGAAAAGTPAHGAHTADAFGGLQRGGAHAGAAGRGAARTVRKAEGAGARRVGAPRGHSGARHAVRRVPRGRRRGRAGTPTPTPGTGPGRGRRALMGWNTFGRSATFAAAAGCGVWPWLLVAAPLCGVRAALG